MQTTLHWFRYVAWLVFLGAAAAAVALTLVLFAGAARAQTAVDTGIGTTAGGATGTLQADVGVFRDVNAQNKANGLRIRENAVTLTVHPTCANYCTPTAGVSYGMCLVDSDEGAGTMAMDQCLSTKPFRRAIRSVNGNVLAALTFDSAGVPVRIELYAQATDKPDEGNAATVGTLAWAIAQYSGTTLGDIYLNEGVYPVAQSIAITSRAGGMIHGAGPVATILQWTGNNRLPMFILDDVRRTELADFKIRAAPLICVGGSNPGAFCATSECTGGTCTGTTTLDSVNATPLNVGIVLDNGPGATVVPQNRRFRNLVMDGTALPGGILTRGMQWVRPVAAECTADKAPWWCCTGVGTGPTCPVTTDVANDGDFIQTVSVENVSAAATAFSIEHGASTGHTFLTCRFSGGARGLSTQGFNAAPTAGSISWYGGTGGGAALDFFLAATTANRSNLIESWDSTGSNALLDTDSASGGSPITIANTHWDATTGTITNPVVRVQHAGPLTLISNSIGAPAKAITFTLNAASGPVVATAAGNYIASTSAPAFTVGHPTLERWDLSANRQNNNGVASLIVDQGDVPLMLDTTDPTKIGAVNLTGLTTATTRTMTWPNRDWTPCEVGQSCAGTSITGNAATATALAANPTDCGANAFATAIDASGNLTCSTPALGTGVTGNYVASVATAGPLTGGAVGSPGATLTVGCATAGAGVAGCLNTSDWSTFNNKLTGPLTGDVTTVGAAATIATGAVTSSKILDGTILAADEDMSQTQVGSSTVPANHCWWGATGILCEGATANAFSGMIQVADVSADRQWTFPNVTGNVCTDGAVCATYQPGPLTGDVTTVAGLAATTIANGAVTLGTKTTGNYVASFTCGAGITGCPAAGPGASGTIVAVDTSATNEINTFTADVGGTTDGLSVAQTLTGGAGIKTTRAANTITFDTASQEPAFLFDGNVSDLTCGAGTTGKMQIMDNGVLETCDGQATAALRYYALANSAGKANGVVPDGVALGGDTTGNYVSALTCGSGLTGCPAALENSSGTMTVDGTVCRTSGLCTGYQAALAGGDVTTVAGAATATLNRAGTYRLTGILGIPNSAALPGTCSVGDVYFNTSGAAGTRDNLCVATNTWAGIDNPFGQEIDATELTNTLTLLPSQLLDFGSSGAELRLPQSAVNPGTGHTGSVVITPATGALNWYSGTLHPVCTAAGVPLACCTGAGTGSCIMTAVDTTNAATLAGLLTVNNKMVGAYTNTGTGGSSAVSITETDTGTGAGQTTNGLSVLSNGGGSATLPLLNGIVGQADSSTAVGALVVNGIVGTGIKSGIGAASSVRGGDFNVKNSNATGAITNGNGVFIDDGIATGPITNLVGLNIANQTVGTFNWSMKIGTAPSYHIGNFMFGGMAIPTDLVDLDGTAARVLGVVRNTTAATAGNALTIKAGGAIALTNNLAGGNLLLQPGINTGQGREYVSIQGYTAADASGSGDGTLVDREIWNGFKNPANNTVTTVATATVASNTVAAVAFGYAVQVFNGTDVQVEEGRVSCHVTNKAGTIANNVCLKFGNQQAVTASALTVTWTITAANPALIQVNANSTLASISAGYPRVTYSLENRTNQQVAANQ